MLKADFQKYRLKFKLPAATSRGTYTLRESWFIRIYDTDPLQGFGLGECAPLPDLSPEYGKDYEKILRDICKDIRHYDQWPSDYLDGYSSIKMGLQTALWDYQAQGGKFFFDTGFCRGETGIPINGLIWMGPLAFMQKQVREKIAEGYRCLKLKIGAMDFQAERDLIREIRTQYSQEDMEIRVDANGAFSVDDAKGKLEALAALGIHSIEQPIQVGQWREMAFLCRESPVPIALDEELIGIDNPAEKESLIQEIRPSYLVLKPSLHGGFSGCEDWIKIADRTHIAWWITSALESNIGLNAIAQWTSTLNNPLPQGLGTGQLFENNFPAPLYTRHARLWMNRNGEFDLSGLHHG